MPTSSVKMCISICAEPLLHGPLPKLWPSVSRAQSARVVPLDHANCSSAAYSLSVSRTDRMRLRTSGRPEPLIGLKGIAFSIATPPIRVAQRKR